LVFSAMVSVAKESESRRGPHVLQRSAERPQGGVNALGVCRRWLDPNVKVAGRARRCARSPTTASAWTRDGRRLRSNYVVIYRYRDGLIGQQEIYYDPSGQLEDVTADCADPTDSPIQRKA